MYVRGKISPEQVRVPSCRCGAEGEDVKLHPDPFTWLLLSPWRRDYGSAPLPSPLGARRSRKFGMVSEADRSAPPGALGLMIRENVNEDGVVPITVYT